MVTLSLQRRSSGCVQSVASEESCSITIVVADGPSLSVGMHNRSWRCCELDTWGCLHKASTVKNMAEEVQNSLAAFWDEARLNAVTSALIQHYFPLTVRPSIDNELACP